MNLTLAFKRYDSKYKKEEPQDVKEEREIIDEPNIIEDL